MQHDWFTVNTPFVAAIEPEMDARLERVLKGTVMRQCSCVKVSTFFPQWTPYLRNNPRGTISSITLGPAITPTPLAMEVQLRCPL